MSDKKPAAATPTRATTAKGNYSQPNSTPKTAGLGSAASTFANSYFVPMLGDILEALADDDRETAQNLSESARDQLVEQTQEDRVKMLAIIESWLTANANGHGATIRAMLGIELAPRTIQEESADIRESIIGQNLEAAQELEPSPARDEHILSAVKTLAQLPPLAVARWKPSFSKLGVDAKTLADLLKKERERLSPPPAADGADREPIRERYKVVGGAFHSVEQSRDGGSYTKKLCNFTARIAKEIARDDGQECTRRFVITGRQETGRPLPQVEIDASLFGAMNWVTAQWGVRAVVHAGQSTRDKLREAIQLESQEAEALTVYTHTGFREIDGQRTYLTTAGALGLEGITVKLEGQCANYALPVDLADVNAKKAMLASLRTLGVAPLAITFPLWGAMFLAPLAEIIPLVFVLWLFGQSGSLKSTLAALFLSHYGRFTFNTLPEGWSSTDNILEKQSFTIKDAPLVIDDFAPQASGIDAQAYERRAARLIRAIGNQSPRNRMNADTTTRPGYRARGLVISTGEQLPSGQSVIARTLPVEVKEKSVNIPKLTRAQDEAELLPQAMAGYITWLIDQWEVLKSDLPQRQRDLRTELAEGAGHLRTPEMFAAIMLGVQLGLSYAQHVGALGEDKAAEYLEKAKAELRALATNQADLVKDERESARFLDILRALIRQGRAHVEVSGQEGKGDWLGWADEDFIYLNPEATFNLVAKFCRDEGRPFTVKPATLYKLLEADKLLVPGGDKSTVPVRHLPSEKPQRVIRLKREDAQIL